MHLEQLVLAVLCIGEQRANLEVYEKLYNCKKIELT